MTSWKRCGDTEIQPQATSSMSLFDRCGGSSVPMLHVRGDGLRNRVSVSWPDRLDLYRLHRRRLRAAIHEEPFDVLLFSGRRVEGVEVTLRFLARTAGQVGDGVRQRQRAIALGSDAAPGSTRTAPASGTGPNTTALSRCQSAIAYPVWNTAERRGRSCRSHTAPDRACDPASARGRRCAAHRSEGSGAADHVLEHRHRIESALLKKCG